MWHGATAVLSSTLVFQYIIQVVHATKIITSLFSISSQLFSISLGRHGIGGHDITSPTELLQSFDRAYGKLKGDVALASNQFVEATYDMKSVASEFKEQHFSLGGLLETYRRGTDVINDQVCSHVVGRSIYLTRCVVSMLVGLSIYPSRSSKKRMHGGLPRTSMGEFNYSI
eukprot:SAG31_NODE_5694_length_2376_cov_1.946860_1_plen_171_part_00